MKEIYKGLNILGSDETGVGDYLTPLVVCACFLPKQNINYLTQIGVKDSKLLDDQRIMQLAAQIKKKVVYRIKHLSQTGYNKLNETFNAHELKMFLHLSAINDLEQKVQDIDLIIIDQFANKGSIQKYYQKLLKSNFNFVAFKAPLKLVEKGEQEHMAVATASILARSFLLEKMHQQNKNYNLVFPLGASAKVTNFARQFVQKYGVKELTKVAKIKFKTTRKVLEND